MKHILPLYDLTPFTMLDFPDKTACIVWVSGCNMRCPYCHNPEIVRGGPGRKSVGEVFDFLEKRQGLIDGVVLSGGEATIYKTIIPFAQKIKEMGYAVKLDTNGSRPAVMREMLDKNLLDYIALDYKAPAEKFRAVARRDRHAPLQETLALLCAQNTVPFEIRTTVHTRLLEEADITAIISDLERHNYNGTYYVQNYRDHGRTLGHLGPQPRDLDLAALPTPTSFAVEYRNFPACYPAGGLGEAPQAA